MTKAKKKPIKMVDNLKTETKSVAKPTVKKTKVEPTVVKADEVVVNRTAPSSISAATFYIGATSYNPRVAHTVDSWGKMCKHLNAGGDDGASGELLAAELTHHLTKPDATHYDFIGYLERRGAITRTKPVKEAKA